MADERLNVVLCWHMHQPDYRDPLTGQSQAPWTYLHAIKDYADMVAHLEAHPQVAAVVNFSATLLDQLAGYAHELEQTLAGRAAPRDALLAALYGAALPESRESRLALVRACLHAHRRRVIDRFPRYQALAEMGRWVLAHPDAMTYLNDEFLIDLIVWYHLAWLGETVRREDAAAKRLMGRERRFSLQDRLDLLGLLQRVVSGIIPRYRALAERDQVELSVTPYSHPILPLLIDFECAREAWPDCPMPQSAAYPGGEERVRWQLAEARRSFIHHFQRPPAGCWPSEGGVSARALTLIDEAGFDWAATGQGVLHNSLAVPAPDSDALHRPYRVGGVGPACFFRDDELSDAIGFVYKDWHGDDAVANLISRLEHIADHGGPGRTVPVILDGENAWEHYPDNAFHFLGGLYSRLAESSRLRTTTFSRVLAERADSVGRLDQLVSGSWVYGTFSTWVGDADKNRAWELLAAAKRAFDQVRPQMSAERGAEADMRLAECEASDWFWWLGDDNPAEPVAQFERLFRMHLTALYRTLGVNPPEALTRVLAYGTADGAVSSMRPSHR